MIFCADVRILLAESKDELQSMARQLNIIINKPNIYEYKYYEN
jgi:hypothetical protein